MIYLYLADKPTPIVLESIKDDQLLVDLQEYLPYVNLTLIRSITQWLDKSWTIELTSGVILTKRAFTNWWLEVQAISKKAGNLVTRADLWFEDFFKGKNPQQAWNDETTNWEI